MKRCRCPSAVHIRRITRRAVKARLATVVAAKAIAAADDPSKTAPKSARTVIGLTVIGLTATGRIMARHMLAMGVRINRARPMAMRKAKRYSELLVVRIGHRPAICIAANGAHLTSAAIMNAPLSIVRANTARRGALAGIAPVLQPVLHMGVTVTARLASSAKPVTHL